MADESIKRDEDKEDVDGAITDDTLEVRNLRIDDATKGIVIKLV